jgi:hypothetical protein
MGLWELADHPLEEASIEWPADPDDDEGLVGSLVDLALQSPPVVVRRQRDSGLS